MNNDLPQDLFLENEKSFRLFFLLHQIDHVRVEFDGSGDSGSIESVYLARNGEEVTLDAPIAVWKKGDSTFIPEEGWQYGEPVQETIDIEEALKDHVYEALEKTDIDWYNNDGGFGHWEWNANTGLEFAVNTRYTESNCEHSEGRQLGQEGEPDSDPAEQGT